MSNDDYCFRRATQSQCNRRNTETVLRAVVKPHKGLKGTKVIVCGCSGRNLKNFSKFAAELESFYCKVAAGNSLQKKAKVKVTRPILSKKRRLHRDPYTSTFMQILKKLRHDFEHLCETASEIMSKKEFIYNSVMFSSLTSVLRYIKIIMITAEEHDKVAN